jgi:hypothetical protein
MMFHGSFADKSEAKKKERQVHGFIKPTSIDGKRRYTVMSERKNPIRRRKRNPKTYEILRDARGRYTWWLNDAVADKKDISPSYRTGTAFNRKHAMAMVRAALRNQDPNDPQRTKLNPMDLVVMGANPRRNAEQELVLHPGQTLTLRVNPFARTTNPTGEIYEEFTGMPADRVDVYDEPHMRAGNYDRLGKLLTLYIKPVLGGQVQTIDDFKGTLMVADDQRKIWFVGGDQDITDRLHLFTHDHTSALVELGELRRLDYKQRKEHAPHPEIDEWQHHLGEENGIKPQVLFDRLHKRLLLRGGDYSVRPEGITN